MTNPDFQAPAELYLGRDWPTAAAQGSRIFTSAAKAIRFAVEEAAPVSLHGARLQIGTSSFSGEDLVRLYTSASYPLARKRQERRRRAPSQRLNLVPPMAMRSYPTGLTAAH
ncbi:MAG: hypothetical protein ACOH2M_16855 [Cypionkella sp.]